MSFIGGHHSSSLEEGSSVIMNLILKFMYDLKDLNTFWDVSRDMMFHRFTRVVLKCLEGCRERRTYIYPEQIRGTKLGLEIGLS